MIAAAARPSSALRLFGDRDAPWIEQLLDLVEATQQQPWRALLERIERTAFPVGPGHVAAIVAALRRAIGGRAERARIASGLRASVLGHPALDRDSRDARIAIAAAELGVPPAELESLLWIDLALERPVVLAERPAALALAARANLDRIQQAVRRAHTVELRIWGDAHEFVRTAARYGLIASIARERERSAGGASTVTILTVTGPLSLFHDTTIYGNALAALVPSLADHARFQLEIRTRFGDGARARERTMLVAPPVLLPPVVPPRRRRPPLAALLADELRAAGCTVEREPDPIASGPGSFGPWHGNPGLHPPTCLQTGARELLFPELAVTVDGARWWIEIAGFATAESLAHKLAFYRAAGIENVVVCVDGGRCQLDDHPQVVPYRRRVDAAAVLARMRSRWGDDDA